MLLSKSKRDRSKSRTLMAHQERALQYAQKEPHPAFFMEMRLGKTLVTVRWVQQLPKNNRLCLVIAPLTVLEAWKRELTFENEVYVDLHGVKSSQRNDALTEALDSSHRVWVLANYETLSSLPALSGIKVVKSQNRQGKSLKRYLPTDYVKWDVVILDESPKIKNPSSMITNICVKGFRDCFHRVILSGLPSPEKETEVFTQFQFLTGVFMNHRNYWQFREKYFQPGMTGYGWVPKLGARTKIKAETHERAYVLRRSQAGMGSKKIFTKRYVETTAKQRSYYKAILKDFAYVRPDGDWVETNYPMVRDIWLQRITGGYSPELEEVISDHKAKEVLYLLSEEIHDKAVIWFKFTEEINLVKAYLRKAGISYVVIEGEVPMAEREKALQKFRNSTRVLLATVKCAKMGLDCSVADTAIYYSNEWSNEDRLQSEDRIVHPKKKTPLLYIDLVTKGTIDVVVCEKIRDKSFRSADFMMKRKERIQK